MKEQNKYSNSILVRISLFVWVASVLFDAFHIWYFSTLFFNFRENVFVFLRIAQKPQKAERAHKFKLIYAFRHTHIYRYFKYLLHYPLDHIESLFTVATVSNMLFFRLARI